DGEAAFRVPAQAKDASRVGRDDRRAARREDVDGAVDAAGAARRAEVVGDGAGRDARDGDHQLARAGGPVERGLTAEEGAARGEEAGDRDERGGRTPHAPTRARMTSL